MKILGLILDAIEDSLPFIFVIALLYFVCSHL